MQSQCMKEPRDSFDPDSGPPSALDYANMDLMEVSLEPGTQSDILVVPTMEPGDSGLRERAYVLWDMSRMKDQDLFYQIEIAPEVSSFQAFDWQFAFMNEWHEICQKMPWDQLQTHYPSLFQAFSGWEQSPIEHNTARGSNLTNPHLWQYVTSGFDSPKHYFCG